MQRLPVLLVVVATFSVAGALALWGERAGTVAPAAPAAVLLTVGPRLTSNQASQPLALSGRGFTSPMKVRLGAPFDLDLPATVLDSRHAFARLPAGVVIPADQSEVSATVTLAGQAASPDAPRLTVVNDQAFVDLTALALSPDEKTLFALSGTTGTLFAVELPGGKVTPLRVGSGASGFDLWTDSSGHPFWVVVHAFSPEVRYVSATPPFEQRVVPGPSGVSAVRVEGQVAYLADFATDAVHAFRLGEGLKGLWRTPVHPNPRALAVAGGRLWVGSLQAGTLQALDLETGKVSGVSAPRPDTTSILGGGTAAFASFIMGGKAPRALVSAAGLPLFVASIGPNIGPNPQRMEVSMNGGVGVVDPRTGKFLRHLGLGAGVPEALALDAAHHLLYAADIGTGQVHVFDAARLALGDAAARGALLGSLPVLPPADFPTLRPREDFGVKGRSGVELHSGPAALALTADGRTLYVLNRFTGTVATVDASGAAGGTLVVKGQRPVAPTLGQKVRRLGQVLYFTDLGRTAMTCDACHLEGHTEGVLFEKTHPMRIYRATTVRGARDTPPFFTPESTRNLAETSREVGNRNRFHNPDLSVAEVDALTLFTAELPTLPNPFVGEDGAPVEELLLPDGHRGHPRAGLALFEGKADCAGCHPAPLFTTDQDPATRGRFLDVGTPRLLPLRTDQQELHFAGVGPPALIGAWDVFPMLTTGAAGFEVAADGTLQVGTGFPLRAVLERKDPVPHGNSAQLSAAELDDLLGYLLSL